MKNNEIGKKFNMLTVIDKEYRNKKLYYLCKCDCGNEKWIRSDSIKNSNQKSCGCLSKETQFKKKDLLGKKFGRLTVIKEIGKKNDRYLWECKCDCGNTHIAEGSHLVDSRTRSCGCLQHKSVLQNREKAFKAHLDKNIIDDTNISIINRSKTMKHNTSGVTGVIWDKSREKWKAEIYFKNRKYYLGRYENKEDAIAARKDAEEKLHKKFLREKGIIE